MTEPVRRHQTRSSMPASKGNRPQRVLKSNLRPVEQNLFVLMSQPDLWHLVDEYVGKTSSTSAMRNALYRRGATTRMRKSEFNPSIVQVWAKWEHPVPDTPAPWLVPATSPPTS